MYIVVFKRTIFLLQVSSHPPEALSQPVHLILLIPIPPSPFFLLLPPSFPLLTPLLSYTPVCPVCPSLVAETVRFFGDLHISWKGCYTRI